MEVGLLIYDDNPKRNLAEKVKRAASEYQQKLGVPPTTCYVHLDAFTEYAGAVEEVKIGEIIVKPLRTMLVNHFWIGIEKKNGKS